MGWLQMYLSSKLPRVRFIAAENVSIYWGSGCDSNGRAVASDTRGPRFESNHQQNLN